MNKNFEFKIGDGLYYDGKWLADFNPQVISKIHYIGGPSSDSILYKKYSVQVTDIRGNTSDVKILPDLKGISYFREWGIPDAHLGNKERSLLEYKLQSDAACSPVSQVLTLHAGLQFYNHSPVMVLGNQVIGTTHIFLDTMIENGFELIPTTSDKDTVFSSIEAYIHLFPGVSEILFFGALFSVVRPILAALRIPAEFLIAIIGPSGHLKTTLTQLYALWLDNPDRQFINFRSDLKMDEILAKIQDCHALNFLADDIHMANSAPQKDRQNDWIDKIVRNASSSFYETNIWITGEALDNKQIFSSRDRMLQVRIPKMDSAELATLKQKVSGLDTTAMASIAYQFATALVSHYDDVCRDIQEYIRQESIPSQSGTDYPTRTYRHGMFLQMTEYLFHKYYLLNPPNIIYRDSLANALAKQREFQQRELLALQRQSEPRDYIEDVYNVLDNSKYLTPVYSREEYNTEQPQYLIINNRCCILPRNLYQALCKYLSASVPMMDVKKALDSASLLETDNNVYTKKILGIRHFVIYFPSLQSYVSRKREEMFP